MTNTLMTGLLKAYQFSKIVEFKDFSRLLSDFPVLFKADLISRTFQESPLNSSTFQACVNPARLYWSNFNKYRIEGL